MMRPIVFFLAFACGVGSALAEPATVPFRAEDLVKGLTLTQAECGALPNAYWVDTAPGGPVCIRTDPSPQDGTAKGALVYVFGDLLNKQAPGGKWAPYAGYDRFSPDYLTRRATDLSLRYGGPVVIVARPGSLGSSGSEGQDRHSKREVAILDGALTQLQIAGHYSYFDLFGHSAGGTIVLGLVQARTDIRCAVAAAGAASIAEAERLLGTKLNDAFVAKIYDPITLVKSIRIQPGERLLMVNDPLDKAVPAITATHYIAELRKNRIPVTHLEVAATDPEHHDVSPAGLRAVTACAHGKTDQEIADFIGAKLEEQ